MTHDEAISLIRDAVPRRGETWADLGAGSGAFTRALASLLGPGGVVYAVDRDASALRELERSARRNADTAAIRTQVADFSGEITLPELDGVVTANALHFVPYEQQARVLARIASFVKPGGPVVVVEYDRRGPDPWVPYPVPAASLATVAHDAGLGAPTPLASRRSRYGGSIYSAVVRGQTPNASNERGVSI